MSQTQTLKGQGKALAYIQLMRLDRPIGTVILLWNSLWGLWLAGRGQPEADLVWVFCLGTLLTRSLGCVINDIADRHFDGHVERTCQRPLARGALSLYEALACALVLTLLCAVLVFGFLNRLSGYFSYFCLAVLTIYPFCKRFVKIPQLVLGIAFASPIVMADLALNHQLSWALVFLYLANALWALVYDTFYALVDRADDEKIGIHSSAIFARGFEVRFLSTVAGLMVLMLVLAGVCAQLGGYYYLGIGVASALLAYEIYRVRDGERDVCWAMFMHSHWVGASIWGGLVLEFLP
ncbi:MAG: 4-hydroxybenzoate octaprenyltransferase [Cardiobacteriaceae bacterium]|nr:4-hydroxybenzoate octaprenyltransferase [Cardiobacteriaceae bacterium]